MTFEEIKNLDDNYAAKTYARFPVAFCGGTNATLLGEDGREYIDFGSGIACNTFGVNDEAWKSAVVEQLNKVQHVSNYYYSQPTAKLASLLCARTGAKRVFFANSGGEANECALKAARKYSTVKYGEGRGKIISLKGSFHGRTLFTLTATGQDEFHKYFAPFVGEMDYSAPTMSEMKKVVDDKTCAVIIEPVQGEGGVRALDKSFVKELRELCDERDILLVFDEVQTGNGRTGTLYAYEQYGVTPDILTTAKGLAGGLPIGACMFFGKTEDIYRAGDHGTTFGGNPVSCAAACNIIERLTPEFLLEVQGKSEYMRAKLRLFEGVNEVSGLGFMIGLSLDKNPKEVAKECLKRGLLVLTAHDKLRLLPPLSITKVEMDEGLTILKEVLKA